MAELSPMMQQYLEIKKQHKDEILFYRIGDFYEMFFDDALTASRELDLTLTGKQCGLEERAPMCGVPFHSYEGYVARLIAKGYKVAICEQVEDPAKAKGLVKRDIIRVVTPGTVIESSMLQDDKNNYIASIFLKGGAAGLCFADVSTGTAHITELKREKIAPAVIAELCRYHPSEVLMNPGLLDCREITAYLKKNMNCAVELVEEERYAPGLVSIALENQFGRDWPAKTGMAEDGLVRFAMAALLEYLHDTQIKGVERLKTVITYNEAQFMSLSPVTRANLELTETLRGREKRGTLLWVLDKTSTAMGKRMLRSWIEQPLVSSAAINRRLSAVESLVNQTMQRGDLIEQLHYIADLERLMTRAVYGSATPKEIYTMAQTCERLPDLRAQAESCGCPELTALAGQIDLLDDVKTAILAAIDPDAPSTLKDGGVIAKGYHSEVDELRSIRDNTKGVLAQLETRLRQETGIPKLKIGYNHVFGYFIEVSNSYKQMVPETYIRKQTLTSGERYITQELKELENKILGAHERLIALEHRLFAELLEKIGGQLDRIQRTANAVAELALAMMVFMARNRFTPGTGSEIQGKTLGIHAYGNVGKLVGRKGKALGMNVIAYDPFITDAAVFEADGVKKVDSLEDLYRQADFLSLHIPATEQTRGSIGYELLMSMPKGATLVNTARKEVIDEQGVVRALTEREDLKYITDIAAGNQAELDEKFGKRVFATAKKMGAETAEANINAGLAAATQIVGFFRNGNTRFQVNK